MAIEYDLKDHLKSNIKKKQKARIRLDRLWLKNMILFGGLLITSALSGMAYHSINKNGYGNLSERLLKQSCGQEEYFARKGERNLKDLAKRIRGNHFSKLEDIPYEVIENDLKKLNPNHNNERLYPGEKIHGREFNCP